LQEKRKNRDFVLKKRLLIAIIFLFGTLFGEAYPKFNSEKSTLKKSYRFASLSNEYQNQDNLKRRRVFGCESLREKIDLVGKYGRYGLSVRYDDFSVYKFKKEYNNNREFIGSSCKRVGKRNFGSKYALYWLDEENRYQLQKELEYELYVLNEKERTKCLGNEPYKNLVNEYVNRKGRYCSIQIRVYEKMKNARVNKYVVVRIDEDGTFEATDKISDLVPHPRFKYKKVSD